MALESHESEDGTKLTIVLDEKFDFFRVQEFKQSYSGIDNNVKSVVIDLHNTQYMDSSALGMLLNMHKSLSQQIEAFSIINCRPEMLNILKIARFDKKFTIEV